ncbi:hypothetical protein M0M57_15715 [Flavobacterium azooxidireducens]|uniref:Uncharacterized protein n=1 Tax=Flavobacterium azooxidireducens TaxID=1871076 RepID=A0ABY4KEC4_9FLAO|nr:hypothetical protein [Flavobacterium azooxidireducens]UPQ79054.1 hypothetical protein M0M57_15715 [Flavobacterium azooxidireducens]
MEDGRNEMLFVIPKDDEVEIGISCEAGKKAILFVIPKDDEVEKVIS